MFFLTFLFHFKNSSVSNEAICCNFSGIQYEKIPVVYHIPNSEPDEDTIKLQVGKFKKSIADILKVKNEITKP